MYEMYPDAWPTADAASASRSHREDDHPHRRARKEHSVVPAVIAQQLARAEELAPEV